MEWALHTVPSPPRLARKALGARWQAGERVGWANRCGSALCARGLIATRVVRAATCKMPRFCPAWPA